MSIFDIVNELELTSVHEAREMLELQDPPRYYTYSDFMSLEVAERNVNEARKLEMKRHNELRRKLEKVVSCWER